MRPQPHETPRAQHGHDPHELALVGVEWSAVREQIERALRDGHRKARDLRLGDSQERVEASCERGSIGGHACDVQLLEMRRQRARFAVKRTQPPPIVVTLARVRMQSASRP